MTYLYISVKKVKHKFPVLVLFQFWRREVEERIQHKLLKISIWRRIWEIKWKTEKGEGGYLQLIPIEYRQIWRFSPQVMDGWVFSVVTACFFSLGHPEKMKGWDESVRYPLWEWRGGQESSKKGAGPFIHSIILWLSHSASVALQL